MQVRAALFVTTLLGLLAVFVVSRRGEGTLGLEPISPEGSQGDALQEEGMPGDSVGKSPRTLVESSNGAGTGAGTRLVTVNLRDAESGSLIESGAIALSQERDERSVPAVYAGYQPELPPSVKASRDGVAFPASIAISDADKVMWVASEGYSWRPTLLSVDRNEYAVDLLPLGSLSLTVSPLDVMCASASPGAGANAIAYVEIRGSRGRVYWGSWAPSRASDRRPLDVYEGMLAINEGLSIPPVVLPVGAYAAEVRLAGRLGVGRVLCREEFAIARGAATKVYLDASTPGEGGALQLLIAYGGTPGEWSPQAQRVILYRVAGADQARVGTDKSAGWSEVQSGELWEKTYDCLQPGSYLATIMPLGLCQDVTIQPGAETPALFDVEQLTSLTLQVPDCYVNARRVFLQWGYVGQPLGVRQTVQLAPEQRQVRIECLARPIWLQLLGDEVGSAMLTVQPELGGSSLAKFDCSGAQTTSARVILTTKDPEIFLHSGMIASLKAHPADSDGRLLLIQPVDHGKERFLDNGQAVRQVEADLYFSKPGSYKITLPAYGRDAYLSTVNAEKRTVRIEI